MADYWASKSSSPRIDTAAPAAAYVPPPTDERGDDGVAYPPYEWVGLAALMVAISAALFFSTADAMHWLGYVLGAVGTAVCVILFRHFDLKRRRSGGYIAKPFAARAATSLLLVGIALGVAHAYFALQTTTIQ